MERALTAAMEASAQPEKLSMPKADRKLKRGKAKDSKKALQQHMMWFDKMPDHCVNCFKPYVKNNN